MTKHLHLTLVVLIAFCTQTYAQQKFTNSVTVKYPFDTGKVYLAYYRGKNVYVQDSTILTQKKSVITFQDTAKYPAGLYMIVFPNNDRFDFVIEKPEHIVIDIPEGNLKKTTITGSPSNKMYTAYQKFIQSLTDSLEFYRTHFEKAKTAADSAKWRTAFDNKYRKIELYRDSIALHHSETMLGAIFNAMKEPAYPTSIGKTRADSIVAYQNYKNNFWNGITFMDDRIVRTPFLEQKLQTYYDKIIPQQSDSIIKDIAYKMLLARNNPELYKYLLNWYTDNYFSPKYMGLDAVYVHLFNAYHSKGLSPWLSAKQQKTIADKAYMLMGNLIGETAYPISFVDSSGTPKPLYNVNSKYTFVVFWDPTCGHCKQELPRIDSIYNTSWKNKGVTIYAANIEHDTILWKQFITEKKLNNFLNVHETIEMKEKEAASNAVTYKQMYNILSTPTMYLLDKDKRILAKQLTLEQFDGFINSLEKQSQ